jgi:penicillin amidase
MNLARALFGLALGRRLPQIAGHVAVAGIDAPFEIGRDRWGIPYIRAESDADAWFGLGFCHGQDRAFQLETLLRVARGTVAQLAGADALAIDRLSRRIGFRRSADRQLTALSPAALATISAYARGINAGATRGLPRRPHEFLLLRSQPTPWEAADVLAILKLQSFFLGSSWDVELARLRILDEDGPEALLALEPAYPDWLPATSRPDRAAGPALDRLASDVAHLTELLGPGGASNNWALAGSRTANGRPILANDPHLAPALPPHWYLCRIETPAWATAGASFVGGPAITAGHNGFCAWGLTAGLVDNADLFIEEVGADGYSVREGEQFAPCAVHREEIQVRGGDVVVEEVLETRRGPLISPALSDERRAISLRAVWLDPLPVEGLLGVHRARNFEEFRRCFAAWPGPSLVMAYADAQGRIGWQLTGQAPRRRKGHGSVPLPGWDPNAGWEDQLVPFDEMPYGDGSPSGYVASANARPTASGEGPFLGEDWLDGYRLARIAEALASRRDWDVATTQALQLDVQSLPWREMRGVVLAAPVADADACLALDLLKAWDGGVSADSAAAAVFELFLTEMTRRAVAAKAPRSQDVALARGFTPLVPQTGFGARRVSQLARLLREQPDGWFARSWPEEVAVALSAAVSKLRAARGDDSLRWAWGSARPLTLRHPVAGRPILRPVFNLGPLRCGGDANTIGQALADPLDPFGNPGAVPGLRMVVDTGDWDRSRFALPGGQSGNPLSRHYADLLPLWQAGRGVPIAWSDAQVRGAVRRTLRLVPMEPEA